MEKEVDLDLEGVTSSFTDLGKAISSLAESAETYAQSLADSHKKKEKPPKQDEPLDQRLVDRGQRSQQLREFSDQLAQAGLPQKEVRELVGIQDGILQLADASKLGLITSTEEADAIKKLRKELVKTAARSSGKDENQLNSALAGAGVGVGDRALGSIGSFFDRIKETTGGMGRIIGNASDMTGLATGGLAGAGIMGGGLALFGTMLFGYTESSRLGAQYGQVLNLASASGDEAYTSGIKQLADFQEKAQHYYAIGKAEIQSNAKQFIDAGVHFRDIFSAEAKSWGEVGQNAVTMTVGLDKFFESGSGFAAKTSTEIFRNYNESLDSSIKLVAGMEFHAKNAGFGVSSFVSWTLQATGNVRELGGNLEETASALILLKKKYQELGFTGESANRMANDALQSLAGGLSGMGTGQQIWLAGKLGLGEGLHGRQELLNGMVRGETSILEKATKVLREKAMQAGGGREQEARFYLQESMHFSGEGARAVLMLGDKFDKGLKITELKASDKAALRKAFVDEGKKQSAIEQHNRETMDGIAEIGKGLITVLGSFLGVAIVGFKAVPVLLYGTDAEKARAVEELDRQMHGFDLGIAEVREGGSKALGGMWHQIEPLIRPIEEAVKFNSHVSSGPQPQVIPKTASKEEDARDNPFKDTPKPKVVDVNSLPLERTTAPAPRTRQHVKQIAKGLPAKHSDVGVTEDAIKHAKWVWHPGSDDPSKKVSVRVEIHG